MTHQAIENLIGDTPKEQDKIVNPFQLHLTQGFRQWLHQESVSLALTTYEGAKLIIIGPGQQGGTVLSERHFPRCMALYMDEVRDSIWISSLESIWQLENGLKPNMYYQGHDKVYLPRNCHVTGGVDVHDLMRASDGHMYAVITGYNCIAQIGLETRGSFKPVWHPPFVDKIIAEDRCHLNGLCLDEDGVPAYVSITGNSNERNGWRQHQAGGGLIMDMRDNTVLAEGLSMPHTPRLYQGKLWFLEAGKGNVCQLDQKTGAIERVLWRPGFLRGLRFYKHYALVCSSAPRKENFGTLPLQAILEEKNETARCALDIIDTRTMQNVASLEISGSVKEIYDVALIEKCRNPVLHGVMGDEVKRFVVLGD